MKFRLLLTALLAILSTSLYGYTLHSDIRYGPARAELPENENVSDRLLDVYIPDGKSPKGGWPVVMYVHGGGFTSGSKAGRDGLNPIGLRLLEKGYAVVSINYILWHKYNKGKGVSCGAQMKNGLPEGGRFLDVTETAIRYASEDAALALKWIKKNGRSFGINPGLIAITGGSAGAITCLYTAFVRPPKGVKIRAVVNCYGAMSDPERLINNPKIPVLTFHGDRDALINVSYSEIILKRLEKIGSKNSRLVVMKGRGHAQSKYIASSPMMDEFVTFLDTHMR